MGPSAEFPQFKVAEIAWKEGSLELAAIRYQVFVVEQKVPETLEWDGIDVQCKHVLARDGHGRPIGTGRLLPNGRLGRLAVLAPWRRNGVGAAMLQLLLAMARRAGHSAATLNAQTYAKSFYTKHGFQAEGEEFVEAGIGHQAMRLPFFSEKTVV